MLKSLHSLLADGYGADHPVCHDGDRLIGWQAFSDRVRVLGVEFAARSESRWLLTADSPLEFAVLLMALLYAGKQAVIPPNVQPGTVAQLEHAFDAIAGAGPPSAVTNAPRRTLPVSIDPHTAIIDMYTSGSTGEPKQIRKTLAQFESEVVVLESLWGQTLGRACIVASAPHRHFYGLLFRVFWPLSSGRLFDNVTCAHPDTLCQRLALFADAALVSTPALLSRLPELIALDSLVPAPKLVFSSGGPLPAAAAAQFHRQLGRAPTEVFGSTETGGIAWRRQEIDDLWTPMPGIRVGRQADGALLLRSPFLADSNSLRMDDAIELHPDGRFRLLGRLDRTVKVNEKRLSLPDLEARLATHPWIAAAAAVALPGRLQQIGAVAVLTPLGRRQLAALGRRESAQALRAHLAAHFEAMLVPRRWIFVEQLPVNERGKLTNASLIALFPGPGMDSGRLPEVLAVRGHGGANDKVTLDLHVGPGLVQFAGHFPGLPILPGVVQIDWAARFSREHLPLIGEFSMMENIKFNALILPDARLELSLKCDAGGRGIEFRFATSQRKHSSGRLVFGGGA